MVELSSFPQCSDRTDQVYGYLLVLRMKFIVYKNRTMGAPFAIKLYSPPHYLRFEHIPP